MAPKHLTDNQGNLSASDDQNSQSSQISQNLPGSQSVPKSVLCSTGIGGPLLCLVSGLTGWHPKISWAILCPIWCVLCVPLTLLFPPLLPIFVLFALQRFWRKSAQLPLSAAALSPVQLRFAGLHLGSILCSRRRLLMGLVILYYLIAFAGGRILDGAMQAALELYIAQAQAHRALQIATPEQLNYSNAVVSYIAIYLVVMVLTIIAIFATTIVACLSTKDNSALRVLTFESQPTAVFTLLLKNLPGLVMILALMYGVIMTVERYYAHLRVIAVDAMVLGNEYFDPSIWFLLLRVYLIYAFFISIVLVLLMGAGLLPKSHQSAKLKPDDQGPSPKMGPL